MRSMTKMLATTLLVAMGSTAMAMQVDAIVPAARGQLEAPAGTNLEVRQAGCMSLNQAVEQVRRQYNGRIVSAETVVRGGRETHVIKVLTSDGTVKTVRMPGCRV